MNINAASAAMRARSCIRVHIKTVECPGCGSTEMEKLISAPGAVMAGRGAAAEPVPACPNRQACGSRACPGALN